MLVDSTNKYSNNSWEGQTEYAFDITKVGHIFYYLLKNKHILLLDGHKIRLTDEIKDKWIKQLPLIKFGYHDTILTTIRDRLHYLTKSHSKGN